MSGHSKWSQIKHKKAITDSKKSQIFGKMAGLISLAAKEGSEPMMNAKLKMAIDRAKMVNMPLTNIEKAIARGAGKGATENLEELLIEIFGPTGKPILVKAITDSRNRTISEIKHILNKTNSKMAVAGSVSWMFQEKGEIISEKGTLTEEKELKLIEAGADDIQETEEEIIILTAPEKLAMVKNKAKELGVEISDANFVFLPKNKEILDEKEKGQYEKLFEALDNDPDVSDFYTTFDL